MSAANRRHLDQIKPTSGEIRSHLNSLWEELIRNRHLIDFFGDVNLGAVAAIDHILNVDFEMPTDDRLMTNTPILFKPMPSEELPRQVRPNPRFKDYDPKRTKMNIVGRARQICSLVLERGPLLFHESRKLLAIYYPSPVLMEDGFDGHYPRIADYWDTDLILEPEARDGNIYPHLIIQGIQTKDGQSGAILYSELAILLNALRNRASQLKIEDEDEQERMSNLSREEREKQGYDFVFPEERIFPVLLLSYVGPQHGRIFYACLEGLQVKIYQSRLYRFEKQNDAPVELFTKFLMSSPILTS
ncbi:hypothetical protein BO78DRAFT_382375 [Aspergillus sclerotiicarbonarius CBS 121057]|uniref:Uncharacterized protein n=1 Tax=Aspergillus sclerotiicarbonarius (strain CBS 121057 / IBT 28362) TaxID=1448318 RepID=A0A319EMX4_ASPSB|nr:hypothetical protein BO78DRAFT_382375 [Aspergillus sclerotiicarbonarius CBS 121057]